MADVFRELERGHEAKFKLDEELRFKAICRRNKLLGRWTAERLGLSTAQSDAYVRRLVLMSLEGSSLDAVIAHIVKDFETSGVCIDEREVIARAEICYQLSLEQVAHEFPKALDVDHMPIGG